MFECKQFKTEKYKFYIFGLCAAKRGKLVREWDVNAVAIYGKTMGERKDKNSVFVIITTVR